ncbi:MAG TPA: SDR family oxidoreductase [Steroidobacteraceae bacterium]
MLTLAGRVALVTGGSRGIGAVIAIELARRGSDVAINYHTDSRAATAVADEIRKMGRRAEIFAADVGMEAEAQRLADEALQAFGSIGILVNNAGFGTSVVGRPPIVEITLQNADLLVRTHVYGTSGAVPRACSSNACAATWRHYHDFVDCRAGLRRQYGTYNIAKAGMEALALTLAKEERGHGIRVNIVAPGLVDTDMGLALVKRLRGVTDMRVMDQKSPFGFVCQAQDIANTVAFLVGDDGRYITGQRINVDGGTF